MTLICSNWGSVVTNLRFYVLIPFFYWIKWCLMIAWYQGTRQIRRPRPPVALWGTEAYFPTGFSVNFRAGCCINSNCLESLTPDNKPMFCSNMILALLSSVSVTVVRVLTMRLILLQCLLINIVIFRTNRTTPREKKSVPVSWSR